jgi:hypothetical protein
MQKVQRVNENFKNLKWYRQCKMLWATSYCFNSNGHILLGGQHVSVWIGILLGGSISLYVTKLDLVLNSIWFRCCKDWIYFILKNVKYDLSISCVKFFKINQHKFVPLFCCSIFHKQIICKSLKSSSMNTWQNILPHHQIFYPMCQIIFPKYFININKIFQKIFIHAHLFMFTK